MQTELKFLPAEIRDALLNLSFKPAPHIRALIESFDLNSSKLKTAEFGDLRSILMILKQHPDSASNSQTHGFLRGRFGEDEYRQLIQEGCIRVLRLKGAVCGFANIMPWQHPFLAQERFITKVKLGVLGVRWTGQDYSPVVKQGNITYIAEVAVDSAAKGAVLELIKALPALRAENPNNFLVATCPESPKTNIPASTLLHRMGFERIGIARVPVRPMKVGEYPGHLRPVFKFQSGIWMLRPLQEDK